VNVSVFYKKVHELVLSKIRYTLLNWNVFH